MKYLITSVPHISIKELTNLLIPRDTPSEAVVELIISIQCKNINIREFGNYLVFIDKLYGRMYSKGIYSYAHKREKQIAISTIKTGSIEVIISEILSKIDPQTLAVIWLVLKFLPSTIKNLTGAYKDIEESRLIRLNRKLIKEKMRSDKILANLDSNRINQLAKIVNFFVDLENRKVPAVIRFSKYFVKKISIHIKQIDKNN